MIFFSENMSKNKIEKRIDKGLPTGKPLYEGIQLWLLTHNKFCAFVLGRKCNIRLPKKRLLDRTCGVRGIVENLINTQLLWSSRKREWGSLTRGALDELVSSLPSRLSTDWTAFV